MNVAPQDRPKVVILTIAIVAMVAIAVVRLYPLLSGGGISTPVPSASATQPTTANAPRLSPSDALEARQSMLEQIEASDTPPGPAGRDPFRPPPGAITAAQTSAPSASRPAPAERRRPLESLPPGEPFAPTGLTDLSSRPAPVTLPPLPTIAVRGVISGDPAVAILTIDQQTYHKTEGEPLGNGLVLARITDTGVVIKYGRRNYPVDVGHSVQPERTPQATSPDRLPSRPTARRAQAPASLPREAPVASDTGPAATRPPAAESQPATPPAGEVSPAPATSARSTISPAARPRVSVRRAARRVVRAQPIYRFSGRRL